MCVTFAQEECLREESRYHYLNCLSGMANAQLQRVEQESRCERGEDELLRDFKSWKAVYTHKVQQQEQYAKELRKRQKAIKENEGPNMEQRAMFAVRGGGSTELARVCVCVCVGCGAVVWCGWRDEWHVWGFAHNC